MDDRDETEAERFDRNWLDMLQELRVVQTGVQLLAGFLLTLPFSFRFGELDVWQVRLYLTVVVVSALAVGVTLVPISVHRRVFGQHVKDRVVATGHLLTQVLIILLAMIILGITTLIFSVTVGWTPALVVAASATLVLTLLLLVIPLVVAGDAAPR